MDGGTPPFLLLLPFLSHLFYFDTVTSEVSQCVCVCVCVCLAPPLLSIGATWHKRKLKPPNDDNNNDRIANDTEEEVKSHVTGLTVQVSIPVSASFPSSIYLPPPPPHRPYSLSPPLRFAIKFVWNVIDKKGIECLKLMIHQEEKRSHVTCPPLPLLPSLECFAQELARIALNEWNQDCWLPSTWCVTCFVESFDKRGRRRRPSDEQSMRA